MTARTGRQKRIKRKRQRARRHKRLLLLRDGAQCHWCRTPLPAEQLTIDHVKPLGQGGANGPTNLVLACEGCNAQRNRATMPRNPDCRRCGQPRNHHGRYCRACADELLTTGWNAWQKARLLALAHSDAPDRELTGHTRSEIRNSARLARRET